jgi:hypothetical protein
MSGVSAVASHCRGVTQRHARREGTHAVHAQEPQLYDADEAVLVALAAVMDEFDPHFNMVTP